MIGSSSNQDDRYRDILMQPVRVCANYRPAFGTAKGEDAIDINEFQRIFSADPLYNWLGLDSPLMYSAHKAAGGMTSIYRQVGIGCERLVREVIQENLSLDNEQVRWGYDAIRSDGKTQRLTLDARIDKNHVQDASKSVALVRWLELVSSFIKQNRDVKGAAFEVRQGYKSADAKRQNADLRFGLAAYDAGYLPVVMVVSTQVSSTVIKRYRQNKLLVLTGTISSDPCTSTYAFFDEVVGYSLAQFFERNSNALRAEIGIILDSLLSPT